MIFQSFNLLNPSKYTQSKKEGEKMNINILKDPQFKEFVRAKDYKPKSITNYNNGLKFYWEFLNKTPTEIIRKAIVEQKNDVWVTDRKIRIYFTNFVDYLTEIIRWTW